ncbi:hypothetical protein CspHIS471_0503390 [Cutaneotrichosporon sp. HIS471]|nr:hypothetical protein CspHIS471_0503390 [Cutaneotrichosporon sp. HIS471]
MAPTKPTKSSPTGKAKSSANERSWTSVSNIVTARPKPRPRLLINTALAQTWSVDDTPPAPTQAHMPINIFIPRVNNVATGTKRVGPTSPAPPGTPTAALAALCLREEPTK